MILMQLLQKWLQDLSEPVLPASQLKNIFGSSDFISRPGAQHADTGDQSAAQEATAEQHAAIVSKLTQLQRALVARLVRCFRLVSEHSTHKRALQDLMRWLAKALTGGHGQCPLSSETAKQLTALQSFLMWCDVHLLHAKPAFQQDTAAPETQPMQPVAKFASCQVLSKADESQRPEQQDQAACPLPGDITQSQNLPLIESRKSDTSHADASEPVTAEEHGCLWLHMRMAKRAFSAASVKGSVLAGH